ncbi:MAG: hypothetical protein QGG40_15235, partial [Myxococcota bacterium]|nr:hypothetical protein [Myxococcota bacterium]
MPSWLWWLVVGCIGSCRVEPPGDSADTSDRACTDQVDDTGPVEHAESFGVAEHAVILVLDGARMEESLGEGTTAVDGVPTEEYLPEIRQRVLPHGTRVHPGVASGVTVTAEGHAELLTGARLPLGNFPSDDGPGVFRPDIPTIYETLRSSQSLDEEQVALVVNTVHLEGLRWSLYPSLGEDQGSSYEFLSTGDEQPVDSDLPVIEAVQTHMESHDTR